MAMNIIVTSKYKPFTYEDIIKPLEGYWKDYNKAEEELSKIETDTAVLQSVIDSMPDGEEKTKYTNYLSSLNSQAEVLASQGLTRDNRNALRNLKTQYNALIPRLSLAKEAQGKDLALYTQRANSGEYFMDSSNSPLNKSVIDYLDGNIPLYNAGINKKTLGADVESVAKAYSSRIFPETNLEEVEKIGNKFIQVTQEQGVNADFSQIEGNEQFMPILNALYEQYGIDKMTGKEQASAKDFVNRKFWEGLIYKKTEDYKKGGDPRDTWVSAETTGNDGRKYSEVRNGKGQVVGYIDVENNKHITPKQYNSLKNPNDPNNINNKLSKEQAKQIKQEREEQLKNPTIITDLGDVRYYHRIDNNQRRIGEFTSQFIKRYNLNVDDLKTQSAKNEAILSGIAKALLSNMGDNGSFKEVNKGDAVHIVYGDMLKQVRRNPRMNREFLGSAPNSVILNLGGGWNDDYHFAAVPINLLEHYIDQTNYDETIKTNVKKALRNQLTFELIEEVSYEETTQALRRN